MIITDRDGYNKVQETFVMHKKGDVIIMRAEKNFKWEKLSLGTCYYPEHWDKSLWRDDLSRMKENGIFTVRMAEFAWNKICLLYTSRRLPETV